MEQSFIVLVTRAELDPKTFVERTEDKVAEVLRVFCEEQNKAMCWGSFGFCNHREFADAYMRGISSNDEAIVARGLSGSDADSLVKILGEYHLSSARAAACKRSGCGRVSWNREPNDWCSVACRDLKPEGVALCYHWCCRKPTWNSMADQWCSIACRTSANTGRCPSEFKDGCVGPVPAPQVAAQPQLPSRSEDVCVGPAPAPQVAAQPQFPSRSEVGCDGPAPAPQLVVQPQLPSSFNGGPGGPAPTTQVAAQPQLPSEAKGGCIGPVPAPEFAAQSQLPSRSEGGSRSAAASRRGFNGGKGGPGPVAAVDEPRSDLPVGTHALCGQLSLSIYDNLETNENGIKNWADSVHTAVIGVKEEELFGQKLVFVVFRGTATFLDWVKNLDCKHVAKDWSPYGVRVHKGYWEQLQECLAHIFQKLRHLCKAHPARRRLVLTGHSQGGGLAMILHAHLWMQLQDGGFPQDFCADTQMMDMFVKAECVAIAGPMVFAPIDLCNIDDDVRGKFAQLTQFLSQSTVNYMLKDDPVPRAFKAVEMQKTLELAGSSVTRRLALGVAGVGIVGGALVAIASPIAGLVLAGVLGLGGASLSVAYLRSIRRSINDKLAGDFMIEFNEYGHQYRHCAKIRCLRKKSFSWIEFKPSLAGFHDHEMLGYYKELTKVGFSMKDYHEFNEAFPINCGSCGSFKLPAVYVSNEEWCQYYQEAKNDNWDNALQKLRQAPHGSINNIIIAQAGQRRGCHFIHQAAFWAKRDIIVELLRFGADSTRLTEDGRDLVVLASEGMRERGAVPDEQFLSWLRGLVARAGSLKDVGVKTLDVSEILILHLDNVSDDHILEPLSHDEFDQAVYQNLLACGYTNDLIRSGAVHGETFTQADRRIRTMHGADGLRWQRKVHSFLDSAKYRQFPTMHQILEETTLAGEPGLASARVQKAPNELGHERGLRWSAGMQLAYVCAPIEEIAFVLKHFPCLSSLRSLAADLKEVETEINRPGVPAAARRGASQRRGAPPSAAGPPLRPADGIVAVRKLVARVEQIAAQSGETDVAKLVSRASTEGD